MIAQSVNLDFYVNMIIICRHFDTWTPFEISTANAMECNVTECSNKWKKEKRENGRERAECDEEEGKRVRERERGSKWEHTLVPCIKW